MMQNCTRTVPACINKIRDFPLEIPPDGTNDTTHGRELNCCQTLAGAEVKGAKEGRQPLQQTRAFRFDIDRTEGAGG